MNTPAQPSPGALRAARIIMTADDPARFAADFAAEQNKPTLRRLSTGRHTRENWRKRCG